MTFAFSAEGRLAYARPDGIGLVDLDGKYIKPLLSITPFNTHSDWAWLPSLAWGADGKTLYFISHASPPTLVSEEDSPFFDLNAILLENNASVPIAQQTGMFSYPSWTGTDRTDRPFSPPMTRPDSSLKPSPGRRISSRVSQAILLP
jgi:hypothetical protein